MKNNLYDLKSSMELDDWSERFKMECSCSNSKKSYCDEENCPGHDDLFCSCEDEYLASQARFEEMYYEDYFN